MSTTTEQKRFERRGEHSPALSVRIHESDPVYGDPYEFVFYLEPPYSAEALEKKRVAMCKLWIATLEKRGQKLTTPIQFSGPYSFRHDERVDLGDKHQGDAEFQLKAMFKREKPLVVASGVVDMWTERRERFGYETYRPTPLIDGDPTSHGVFDTRNHPFGDKPQRRGD